MENCEAIDYEVSELSIDEWCQIAENHPVSSDEMMEFLEGIVDIGAPQETAESVTVVTSFQGVVKNRVGVKCGVCGKGFGRKDALERHMKIHARTKQFQCSTCTKTFYRKDVRLRHEKSCCRRKAVADQLQNARTEENTVQVGRGESSSTKEGENDVCESALNGNLRTTHMKPRINEKYDLTLFLKGKKANIFKNLQTELEEKKGVKWFISTQVKMVKYRPDGQDEYATPHFRSNCQRLTNLNALPDQYEECAEKIIESFQTYQREGSGWQLLEVRLHLIIYDNIWG